MVLVFLAIVWAIILIPTLLRRRRSGDSISHFHHQLGILQRRDTPQSPPPYRLQSVPSTRSVTVNGSPITTPPILTVVGCEQLPRPALAYLGKQGPSDPQTPGEPDLRQPARVAEEPARVSDAFSRQVARKRRRDTLMVLVLTFACSVFLGMIPATHVLWVLSAVSGVAIVAYVALLVHLRGVAEERERKLHYLRPEAAYETGTPVSAHYDEDGYREDGFRQPADRSLAVR